MDQRMKIYWLLLIVNVILTSIAILSVIYFVSSSNWAFTADDVWQFILPLIFFLLNSLFILFFIKNRYPVKNISNKIEGFAYMFALFTFLSAFLILLINSVIAVNVIEKGSTSRFRLFLFYVSIPSGLAMIVSVTLAIYSFKVLNAIRTNLRKLAQQIKNIGTENEADTIIKIDD